MLLRLKSMACTHQCLSTSRFGSAWNMGGLWFCNCSMPCKTALPVSEQQQPIVKLLCMTCLHASCPRSSQLLFKIKPTVVQDQAKCNVAKRFCYDMHIAYHDMQVAVAITNRQSCLVNARAISALPTNQATKKQAVCFHAGMSSAPARKRMMMVTHER